MNSSSYDSSNEITDWTLQPSIEREGISPFTQISNIIICVLAICGNMLTMMMFATERKLLKKPYNILILALAIADVLAAISVITNPAFVLGDAFPYPSNPIMADIVCRLIWSRAVVFQLVFFSIYITLGMTAERWCAIVKPHIYKNVFSRKNVLGYIIFSWAWTCFLLIKHVQEVVYTPSSKQVCQFSRETVVSISTILWNAAQILLKIILPCLAVVALYIHMIIKTNKSPFASLECKAKLKGRITRMLGVSSFILISLFIPNQVIYFLSWVGKAKLDTPLHHFTSVLTFMTLCINPFIYGLSNKNYQQRYKKMAIALCPRGLRGSDKVVVITNSNRAARHRSVKPVKEDTNPGVNKYCM